MFNFTTFTKNLALALPSTDYPTVDMTAPSHVLESTVCSSVCMCMCDTSSVIYIIWRCLIFCGPSQYTGNQLCGHVTIVFTSFSHVWVSWGSESNIPTVNPKQSHPISSPGSHDVRFTACVCVCVFVACTYRGGEQSAFSSSSPRSDVIEVMNSLQILWA